MGRLLVFDLSIFNYDFMQRAFWAIIAMSLFSPILGVFLILRRQSLMSDTLSHVSLAGVAFGIVLGISPTVSTVLIVIVAAIFLEYLRTIYKNFMEIGTAILMSTGLAISFIVMNKSGGKSGLNLEQYLFGSIVTISQEQVAALFGIALIVIILTVLFLRPMYVLTFDEDTAFVDGLPVRVMSIAFNIVTGVAIALMIPAAGALLVSTIMVLPASIALRLGKSFKTVLFMGMVIGFLGMVMGLLTSYYMETPASASITLIFISIFLLANLVQKLKK
ncbi:metal ABC transporter permease [Streptococcus ruminantium]|uniref:metal ABC transporter permease n=1 Tax=Streptococcus ruminantium TaxID=1917441 RepID=UPI0013EEFB6E|nr:metal ABC transporter permease [Streptococcus ruminantium]